MGRLLVLLAVCACTAKKPAREETTIAEPIVGKVVEGREMIGEDAPPLDGIEWVDGADHPLREDRGKVVLVRWWTDTCPLCANSSKAIRALTEKHGDRMVVRAVYHNKVRGREVDTDDVKAMAEQVGYPWVVGLDPGWQTLRRWWLDQGGRNFTSVSFLLDKRGRVRLIHTGGEFHTRDQVPAGACQFEPAQCEDEYEAIDRAIGALVSEE